MAFIYDLTDTWNAGGTTFNAIKMNVTDTASAAASKLVTLQVGGSERFGVDKAGIGTFASVVRAAGGSTGAPAFSFNGDTNTGMWSPSSDAIAFSTAGSERVRVDASGNVGIGVTSPQQLLAVGNSTDQVGAGVSGAVTTLFFGTPSNMSGGIKRIAYDRTSGYMNFIGGSVASPSTQMTIDTSGNLLVGTTTQTNFAKLTVYHATASNNGIASVSDTTAFKTHLSINNPNGEVGYISSTGTTTTYSTSSDARLKHDIVDAPEASSLIDAIKVRSFKWNADNSEQRYGMVAQELLEVAPEAVSVPADEDQMMGVDYSKLVPMLIKEVQSLRARVAQLEGN